MIDSNKHCYFCGSTNSLHSHHIFFGLSNRKLSEKYGLKVWLCILHHTGSNEAVHLNITNNMLIKREGQRYFEEKIGTREEFISEFGKNYL